MHAFRSVVKTSVVEKWQCFPREQALAYAGTRHALPAPHVTNCWWI